MVDPAVLARAAAEAGRVADLVGDRAGGRVWLQQQGGGE
jgi:hypothetical protein